MEERGSGRAWGSKEGALLRFATRPGERSETRSRVISLGCERSESRGIHANLWGERAEGRSPAGEVSATDQDRRRTRRLTSPHPTETPITSPKLTSPYPHLTSPTDLTPPPDLTPSTYLTHILTSPPHHPGTYLTSPFTSPPRMATYLSPHPLTSSPHPYPRSLHLPIEWSIPTSSTRSDPLEAGAYRLPPPLPLDSPPSIPSSTPYPAPTPPIPRPSYLPPRRLFPTFCQALPKISPN